MKKFFLKMMVATALVISGVACSEDPRDDEPDDGGTTVTPVDPEKPVDDPEGTITLSMRSANNNGETTYIDHIYINKGDNFDGEYVTFSSVGKVNGLGNIVEIPKSAWAGEVSAKPGYGYVAYDSYYKKFYRIFVEDYILDAVTEGVIGAEVKYQEPFYGSGKLKVAQESVIFNHVGGRDTINFTQNEIVPVNVKSEKCEVQVLYDKDLSLFPKGVIVIAEPNTSSTQIEGKVIITSGKDTTTEIPVTVQGTEPYLALTQDEVDIKFGETLSLEYYTNIETPLKVTTDAPDWLGVAITERYLYIASSSDNYSATDRQATVTITDEDNKVSCKIIVKQEAAYISADISSESIMVGYNAQFVRNAFKVRTNMVLSDIKIKSDQPWASAVKTGDLGDYNINILENNDSGNDRMATLTLYSDKAEGVFTEIKVVQQKAELSLSTKNLYFGRLQENETVILVTPLSEFSAESDASWCTFTWNEKDLTIRVEANDTRQNRTAKVSVTIGDGQKETIIVEQGYYALGDLYDENGVKGIVFEQIGFHGKIVSLDEAQTIIWSNEDVFIGSTSEDSGMENMNVVKQIYGWESLYPAFAWCDGKNINSVTGWYLPAVLELEQLLRSIQDINNGLIGNGGVELKTGYDDHHRSLYYYWSSTEIDSKQSHTVYFYRNLEISDLEKNNSRKLRHVRAIYAY